MALVECPHCTTRVARNARATCPSCGGHLDAKREKTKYVRTTVSDVERLPSVCCRCGTAADRTVWLGAERNYGGQSWPIRILYYLGMGLFGLIVPGLLIRTAARGALSSGAGVTRSTRRRVPVCRDCKRRDPPAIDHVDLDTCELTFAAHRTFARELAKLRGQRTDEAPKVGPYRDGAG